MGAVHEQLLSYSENFDLTALARQDKLAGRSRGPKIIAYPRRAFPVPDEGAGRQEGHQNRLNGGAGCRVVDVEIKDPQTVAQNAGIRGVWARRLRAAPRCGLDANPVLGCLAPTFGRLLARARA